MFGARVAPASACNPDLFVLRVTDGKRPAYRYDLHDCGWRSTSYRPAIPASTATSSERIEWSRPGAVQPLVLKVAAFFDETLR